MKTKTLKDSLLIFLAIVTGIYIIFSFVKLSSLTEQVKELQFNRDQLLSKIEEQNVAIDEIHQNVDEQLRKQASLFSSINYRYEGFSAEEGTTNMILTVIPKTISDDMKITVMLDGNTSEFVRGENDVFTALIPTYIFLEGESPLILMEANGERKTEVLSHVDTEYLFVNYLPAFSADVEGVANYNQSTEKLKMDASLTVEYNLAKLFDAHFVDMSIVVKTNEKEIAREDITNNVKGTNKNNITSGKYTAPFTDTYTVILGEDFYVYLVATDSLGYTHEYLAYHWLRNTDHATPEFWASGEQIYDAEGNLLFGGK